MVEQLNIKGRAFNLQGELARKRQRLEQRRAQFYAVKQRQKPTDESALLKGLRDIGDGMVSLVTEPDTLANRLKRRRDAYRYNRAQIQKLVALRDAYRLSRKGIKLESPVNAVSAKMPNGISYRYGRQNVMLQRGRVNPALVRFMMGRDSR